MDDAISLAKSLLSERLNNAGNNQSTTASPVEDSPQSGELPQQGSLRGGQGVLYPQGAQDDQSPLEGLPTKVSIPRTGETLTATHDPRIRAIAADYMQSSGLQYNPPRKYVKVDPDRGKRIADEYESMEHDPYRPLVKASYDALAKETIAQYNHAKAAGLKLDFWNPDEMEDPYAASPRLMTEDVRKNHHMYVFPTDYGYGNEPISDRDREENPMLRDTGETWNGKPVLINDMFRAIHDYFGHAKEGVGFRGDGEENAWRSHASMYSPLARLALGTETRGQNSWLNYGPHGEKNRTASTEETVFAPPKIGLMPSWVHHEGGEDFTLPEHIEEMRKIHKRYGKAEGGIIDNPDDDPGITAYHGSPHDFEQFDMSKIGTGEGNQSYGHGLYFAQNEDVAKGYRDQLAGHHPGDVLIGDEKHPHWASRDVINAYRKLGYDNDTAVIAAHFLKEHKGDLNAASGATWSNDKIPDSVAEALLRTEYATPAGHMYEVRINAHPDHFLDWDKPFHEQSDHVKRGLRSIPEFDERVAKYGVLDPDYKSKISMGEFINRGVLPHSYDKSGPEFSNAYHVAGIKGVKYLDQGSRWGDKKNPTSNYVVFDDKLVNVKRKYAKGGAIGYAGGGDVEYQSTGDKVVNDGAINWGSSDSPADFFRADKALQQLRPEMFQQTSPTTAAVATETRPTMPAPVANPPAIVAPAATARESVAQAVPSRQPTVQPSNDQRYGLFAVGTNDFKNPKVAYQNALNIIDNAAGSNIKPVLLLPNSNDPRFRDVSDAVRRAAEERGITYHVPEYDPNDPLHMTRKSAQSFAKQYPNAFLGGDSNIVRLANWGYGLPTSNKGNAYVDPQTGMMMGRVGAGSAEISNWLAKYRQSLQQRKRGGSIVDRALMLTSKKA